MFEAFQIPLRWTALLRTTVLSFLDHDGLNLAAELAFYSLLAIFPALLFVTAFASFFPLLPATERIVTTLSSVAPRAVVLIITQQLLRISEGHHSGLLTIGFLGSLWSGSSALTSTFSILNALYGIRESRSWWRVRLVAFGLTMIFGLLFVVAAAIVLGGPALAARVAHHAVLDQSFQAAWIVLKWPTVLILISAAVGLVFQFGPDADRAWEWLTPGAVTAAGGWLIASVSLRALWFALFASYTATFGTIGGFIALITWLYVSAIAILAGAEMDAAIERASPHAGYRRGGRRVIGRLARTSSARSGSSGRRRALPLPRPLSAMARHIARHRFSRPSARGKHAPPAKSASQDSSD